MNILSIDRGSKRIGLAWMDTTNCMPLPLGYLLNNVDTFPQFAALVMEYNIEKILYGYPVGNKSVIEKIDRFVNNIRYCVSSQIVFESIDEHYSSIEASDRTGDLDRKHISQDTVSAMMLLERWSKNTLS